jgi:proline iminopeptidase
MDTIVDDVEKVRIALGLEKIAMLGHSMFSLIPPAYALKYPDNASHLIITDGVPYISEKQEIASKVYFQNEASAERKEILERNLSALTEEVMSKLSPSEAFIRRYISLIPLFFRDPEYDMSSSWDGVELDMDFIDRYRQFIGGVDHTDQFHRIKAPVLVISGRYDFWAVYTLQQL